MAYVEPYFQVFINDDDDIMFVLSSREQEPSVPKMYFDGESILFIRDGEEELLLQEMTEDTKASLLRNTKVMVAETAEGSLTVKGEVSEDMQFPESIDHVYDVELNHVNELPPHEVEERSWFEKSPTEWLPDWMYEGVMGWITERTIITGCWMIMLLTLGLLVQQFIPSKNYYKATMLDPELRLAMDDFHIQYGVKSKLKIFGADFYRSSKGAFLHITKLETLGTTQRQEISRERAEELRLVPVFTWWDQNGMWVILGILLFISFLGSFIPFRYFKFAGMFVDKIGK